MEASFPILATFRDSLSVVSATVASYMDHSRSDLGRRVYRQFNFLDAKGELRLSGCMKALHTLECEGHFTLPEKRTESPVRGVWMT